MKIGTNKAKFLKWKIICFDKKWCSGSNVQSVEGNDLFNPDLKSAEKSKQFLSWKHMVNKTMRKLRDKEKEYQVIDTRKASTKNTVQSKNIKVKYSYFCKNVEKRKKKKKKSCAKFDEIFFEVWLTFKFYLLAIFSKNVMVRNAIDSKLWCFVNFARFLWCQYYIKLYCV